MTTAAIAFSSKLSPVAGMCGLKLGSDDDADERAHRDEKR